VDDDRFVRCRTAATLEAACEGLADDLIGIGFGLPSVYLLAGERLRCQAARGYFQVVDGFAPGAGVIGKVVASGQSDFVADVSMRPDFIFAVPGLVAEICVPVHCGGAVVGAVSVESFEPLEAEALLVVEEAATVLGASIERLGGAPKPSLAQRLVEISVELTRASLAADVEAIALRAAIELSGMTSAAIAHVRPDRSWTSSVLGPLGPVLAGWRDAELAVLTSWVSNDTSSHFSGGEDVPAGYEFLHGAGIRSITVHPLVRAGTVGSLLVAVASSPVAHSPSVVDCLALLSAHTAASLAMAMLLEDATGRADHDGLTGLGNRSILESHLAGALGGDDHPAVLVLDLDDFKQVNDRMGHLVGDQLLAVVAERIRGCLRDGDHGYRLGGDEFVVVLGEASEAVATSVAARLLTSLERPFVLERGEVETSVSIGIALVGSTPTDLLARADHAMYEAKRLGKGRWALASAPA